MENILKSPVRWVGGKRGFIEPILCKIPIKIKTYVEPFVGGGSIFLEVLSRKLANRYIIGDINAHVVNMWEKLRNNFDEVFCILKKLKMDYDELENMDQKKIKYHQFRDEFNNSEINSRHAALFMTLNKTSFNALVRYNGKGKFNSAFGKRKLICHEFDSLIVLSKELQSADISFRHGDFSQTYTDWGSGDFAYFDPPYHPLNKRKIDEKTYNKEGFNDDDEKRLRNFCDLINKEDSKFILSNHYCKEILNCFDGYKYEKISSRKVFSGKSSSRVETFEILLSNIGTEGENSVPI